MQATRGCSMPTSATSWVEAVSQLAPCWRNSTALGYLKADRRSSSRAQARQGRCHRQRSAAAAIFAAQ